MSERFLGCFFLKARRKTPMLPGYVLQVIKHSHIQGTWYCETGNVELMGFFVLLLGKIFTSFLTHFLTDYLSHPSRTALNLILPIPSRGWSDMWLGFNMYGNGGTYLLWADWNRVKASLLLYTPVFLLGTWEREQVTHYLSSPACFLGMVDREQGT